MIKYIQLIKNNRKKLLIILLLINILSVIGIFKLEFNVDFDIFKIDDSKHLEVYNEMEDIFPSKEQTILLIESDSLDEDFQEVNKILEENDVKYFVSPLDILTLLNLEEYDSEEEAIKQLKGLSPITYKDNKIYGTYNFDVKNIKSLNRIEDILKEKQITYFMSGNVFMASEILKLLLSILIFIPPLALFFILLIFRTQLSSFKATIMSILPAGLASLWVLGIIGWFGGEVSVITVLAPIFAIVIGSADGLHFISHMEEEFRHNKSNVERLHHTLSIVGIPLIITTATSVIGFLGLLLIDTEAIRDLAIFASIGVFFAGIITWYILPIILTGDIKLKYKDRKYIGIYLKELWGMKSIVIVAILLVLSFIFIPNIKTEFNQLMFFRDYTSIAKNNNKIIEVNEGVVPLYYFGKLDRKNKEKNLQDINEMVEVLKADENIDKIANPFELMPILESEMSLDRLAKAKQFIRLNNGKLFYRILIFPKDLNNKTINNIYKVTRQYKEDLNGDLVGIQFLMSELNESVISGQVKSIIFTYLLILVMLYIAFKSIKLTFISSLPILFTSIIIYGFLGLTGISLSIVTSTIFSITLGIGVDYAIHYTSVYKYYLDRNSKSAREEALKYSVRPIIANALGLSIGMTALLLSPLQIHVSISIIIWVAMSVAVFMSLTLLPTLLGDDKTTKQWRNKNG